MGPRLLKHLPLNMVDSVMAVLGKFFMAYGMKIFEGYEEIFTGCRQIFAGWG